MVPWSAFPALHTIDAHGDSVSRSSTDESIPNPDPVQGSSCPTRWLPERILPNRKRLAGVVLHLIRIRCRPPWPISSCGRESVRFSPATDGKSVAAGSQRPHPAACRGAAPGTAALGADRQSAPNRSGGTRHWSLHPARLPNGSGDWVQSTASSPPLESTLRGCENQNHPFKDLQVPAPPPEKPARP